MAWQAPTLRPASLELKECLCNESSFASIIPSNDRARIEAAFLAEKKAERDLCQWHVKFFHARKIPPIDAYTPTDSYSGSDIEDDYSESWDTHYGLNLDDLSPQAATLTFRIGSGASETSKEDDGVEIVTSCPERSSHRVASVHCAITFGSGGVCLIKALSSTQPTIIFIDNEPLTLTLGETHVLCYRTNRFRIGKLEYNFVYNKLENDGYLTYIDQRNTLYKSLGGPLPDPRVWEFPSAGETRIHGPAIMQVGDGGGVSESVRVGVHIRTGRPLAIKSFKVGARRNWDDIIGGIQALLSFKGARGLLQALEIFTELARTNFHEYSSAKWAEQGIPFKLSVLRDILEGLKTLHAASFMHRGISEHNLLLVSENPPVAMIGNLEQSIESRRSVDEQIGPAYIRAPEVNGSEYSNKVDIWNLAFVAISMFFPAVYKDATNFDAPQDEFWYAQVSKQLDIFRLAGKVEASIEQVLRAMLDRDPNKRPSAVEALACLPDFNRERMVYEELPTFSDTTSEIPTKRKAAAFSLDGPSRKLQKLTGRRDIAVSGGSDDEEDSGDIEDSKSIDQDGLDSTPKVLRNLSPDSDLQSLLKAMPHGIDDWDIALSSEGDNEEDADGTEGLKSSEEDRIDSALKVLRSLAPNSDLHQLLEAMPRGVSLVDLVLHCKGKDAQIIRSMLRGQEKLKELLGLEISSDSGDEESISVPRTSTIEDSGSHSERSPCQQRRKGSPSLANFDAPDQRTDAGTSSDQAEAECKDISQPTDLISTGPEILEEKWKKEVQYIDLEDSEEE